MHANATQFNVRQTGAEGDRTHDLLHAMQALSQLSYGPHTMSMAIRLDVRVVVKSA